MCSIAQLPPELFDKILDEMGANLDTLKNCSLVCHSWSSRATRTLFTHARVYLRSAEGDTDVIDALLSPGRVHDNVANICIYTEIFEKSIVVKTLPSLRELLISPPGMPYEEEFADKSLVVPEPTHLGRSIENLVVQGVPLLILDWILNLFASINSLKVRCVLDGQAPLDCARHTVRSLDTSFDSPTAAHYLADSLDLAVLEDLTVSAEGPFTFDDRHETLADFFVQQVRCSLKSYHHIECSSMIVTVRPPDLSACKNLVSVSFSTDAFGPLHSIYTASRATSFLTTMPPSVTHVRFTYTTYWTTAEGLTGKVRFSGWSGLGNILLQCAPRARVEISVEQTLWVVRGLSRYLEYPRFLDDPKLSEVILDMLPRQLRDRVNFV